ncbi:MAG: NAD(P)-dependent oxidoreductase [Desulfococcaceae bacterium]
MTAHIGFIGTGIMGGPMALNVLRGGFDVTVWNRTREKNAPHAEAGAAVAENPAAMAELETVILMLTGPEAVESVLFGENGLLTTEKPALRTLVNMSTVNPAFTRDLGRRLAERDAVLVDAPVAGTKKPAEDGELVVFAAAPTAAVDAVEPLLLTMSKKVVRCGDAAGSGSATKMVFNLLLAHMLTGLAEALNLGERQGLSVDFLMDVILAGPLGCGLFQYKSEMMRTGEFPTQFPFKHMAKDLGFARETAEEVGAAVPLGDAVARLFQNGLEKGLGDEDFAAVRKVLSGMNER